MLLIVPPPKNASGIQWYDTVTVTVFATLTWDPFTVAVDDGLLFWFHVTE